jgi:hypothetical protein
VSNPPRLKPLAGLERTALAAAFASVFAIHYRGGLWAYSKTV